MSYNFNCSLYVHSSKHLSNLLALHYLCELLLAIRPTQLQNVTMAENDMNNAIYCRFIKRQHIFDLLKISIPIIY
jgi:hypothetical protein